MTNTKKLLGLLSLVLLAWPVASRAATTRNRLAGHSFLSLDDVTVGPVRSVTQTSNEIAVKLDPSELSSGPLGEWLSGSFTGRGPGMETGAVVFTDFNYRKQRRLEFGNATLSGIDFPAFAPSSKGPVYVTLRMRVQKARSVKAVGKTPPVKPTPTLGSDFMLLVSGVDTSHVSWVQLSKLTPRKRSTYRLGVAMKAPSFKSFKSWYKSRQKKDGALVIADSSGTMVLTLRLGGLLVSSATWSTASKTGSAAITFDSIATR